MDARVPPQGARPLREAADAELGRAISPSIDFDNIFYYIRPTEKQGKTWDEVPEYIKNTFEKLGIPEAERKFLAGVGAQYESEVIYHSLREDLAEAGRHLPRHGLGVREHPDLVKQYFGTIIPANDNKFAALNSAVWSGGSFIYVPEGVKVEVPLQAYFRINAENMGQFERTLIICDAGLPTSTTSRAAPRRPTRTDSLHSAVVEIIVQEGARCRYTTIQNWSKNVYNLVTKRAAAYKNATMEWVDGNLGSKLTMKYPAVWLMEAGRARRDPLGRLRRRRPAPGRRRQGRPRRAAHLLADHLEVDLEGDRPLVLPRSGQGLQGRRERQAATSSATRCCSTRRARPTPTPTSRSRRSSVSIGHEATVSKVAEEQIFYLQSRGLTEDEAMSMIVNGFIEPIAKELPLEYAVELNRLIQLEMEGSVG